MVINSININKTNNHFSSQLISLNIKRPRHITLGFQGLAWDMHKTWRSQTSAISINFRRHVINLTSIPQNPDVHYRKISNVFVRALETGRKSLSVLFHSECVYVRIVYLSCNVKNPKTTVKLSTKSRDKRRSNHI